METTDANDANQHQLADNQPHSKTQAQPVKGSAQKDASSTPAFTIASYSKDQPTDAELTYTRNLLESTRTQGGFKCPKCELITKDPEVMLEHLVEEINNSYSKLVNLGKLPRAASAKRPPLP